jgi:hypothetical protein
MSRIVLLTSLAFLTFCAGCTRQPAASSSEAAASATQAPGEDQKLPFDRPAAPKNVLMPSTAIVPTVHSIPAGVTVDVRLQAPISSATAHSGAAFSAVLERPVIVDGETVLPAGTSVSGRIVTAKRSLDSSDRGFLRLTLSAVTVGGKQFPVESSNFFARGAPNRRQGMSAGANKNDVQLSAERQLSFRLARPLLLN